MNTWRIRPTHRLVLAGILALILLLPGDATLAADWYPNEYYLHGHTDFDDPCTNTPCMRTSAYSLTTDGFVWIGTYAEVADYCSSGGWGTTYTAGWNWTYDWPNAYHRARTTAAPARTCTGHSYKIVGGHNIHTDPGATWPVDFTGWT